MKLTIKYIFTGCCLFVAAFFIFNFFTKSTINQYSLSLPIDNFEQQNAGEREDFKWTKISGILKRRKASLEQWCLENKKMQVPRLITLKFFIFFLR